MRNALLLVLLAGCFASACATSKDSATTVFYLQHTKAEDMADTVGQFLAEARASGARYPTVRADAETNALLLKGEPETMPKMIMLIKNLDVQRPK